MKKMLSAMLALTLCLALGGTALADGEPYETAGDLYQSWYEAEIERTISSGGDGQDMKAYPYPDFVAGVWTEDGSGVTLTFALVEGAGDVEKETILSQVRDKSTVRFAEGFPYSIAELYALQEALVPYLGDETGAFGVGIRQQGNVVEVDIDMLNPGAEAFMQDCFAKYGDRVAFENGGGVTTSTAMTAEERADAVPTAARPFLFGLYWLLVIAALAALAFVFLRRRNAAARTPEGVTVNVSYPTARQVEDAVEANTHTPSEALHRAVQEKIGIPRA